MISVIIPTKNRIADLIITLERISLNSVYPIEIIIVDQTAASNETTLMDYFGPTTYNMLGIKYFHTPEINGIIPARDYGYHKTHGDILLFMDDDITVFPDFFKILTNAYDKYSEIDGISAVELTESKLSLIRILLRILFWRGPFSDQRTIANRFHYKFKNPLRTSYFSAGYMSVKRYVYEDIGFDQDLTGHVFAGDIDFSYRASKKYRLVLHPLLKIVHRGGLNPSYNLKEGERKRIHARFFFFKKNIEKNFINYTAFIWLIYGSFLAAAIRSLTHRSIKPIEGFFAGLREI
jgi:glycosyltransferase involved in cell wall biosynthesis